VERGAGPSGLMTQIPLKDRNERVDVLEVLQRLGMLGEHHVVEVVPKLGVGERRVVEMGPRQELPVRVLGVTDAMKALHILLHIDEVRSKMRMTMMMMTMMMMTKMMMTKMMMKMMKMMKMEFQLFAPHQHLLANEVVDTEGVDDTKDKTASSFRVLAAHCLQHGQEPA